MKRTILSILFLCFVAALAVLLYKHAPRYSAPAHTLPVTTSFYPLYFFAQEIGGDKASVLNITHAGAEPHDYEPSAQDVIQIEKSKILLLNGRGLEAWGGQVEKNLNPRQTRVVVTGEGLQARELKEQGVVDPHVWLSPPLAVQMVDKIEQGFAQVDPKNASYYQANANILKQKLQALDRAYAQGLSLCKQTDIITSHAAFGYLASTYNFHQISIAGLSPDAEPSQKQLQDLATLARQKNIKYIFFESLANPKLSQTLAQEVGAQTLVLDPIEGLTDEDIFAGKNYLTEMQQNLKNLELALQCPSAAQNK